MKSSIDKTYLKSIRRHMLAHSEMRRVVIKRSDDALHLSKRAIFAIHRDDLEEAEEKIVDADKLLRSLSVEFKKNPELKNEGSYRASLEEYVEVYLLLAFMRGEKISRVPFDMSDETYVAGLSDVVGELYRLAIHYATVGDRASVERVLALATDIVGELIECNLTKYLRTKFDQAKSALSKIEKVIYDLSLS
jgi:translin